MRVFGRVSLFALAPLVSGACRVAAADGTVRVWNV